MALNSLDDSKVGKKRTWQDGVQVYKWKKGLNRVRLFGLIYTDARHNIKTKSGKGYYEFCHGYDSDNDRFYADKEERCEACRLKVKTQIRHYINLLSMDAWDNQPKNPPANWSPIYIADFSPSLIQALQALTPMNRGHSVAHPTKGAIVYVNFNPDAPSPAQMYSANIDPDGVNWAFTEEMLQLTVSQEMPNGTRQLFKGDGKVPGGFVYQRATNDRDEMIRGLERNGYYGETTTPSTKAVAKRKSLEIIDEIESDELPTKSSASLEVEEDPELDATPSDDDVEIEIPF